MNAIERLEELLNQKDDRIEELEREIETDEEEKESRNWEWTRHRKLDEDQKMPVPRLQIECLPITENWYQYEWRYDLVYEHTTGDIIAVPMGHTRASG